MTRLWKRFLDSLGALPAPQPGAPPAVHPPAGATGSIGDDFPRTYRPATPDDGASRPRVFDPALVQFPSAFRPGDPTFPDAAAGRQWVDLRRRATDHVLRRIAESPRGNGLILRGSRLLRAWLGDAAREPGDLDWVADPTTVRLSDPGTDGLFDDLIAAVFAPPAPDGVEFVSDGVAVDDIWTYERAPGRRVVFPWRATGRPGGAVQVDVVFGETLTEPARRTPVPAADGGCVSVLAVGPGQSLAWKLLWLGTDMHPQGKDLYDAVLLAERFPLPAAVLEHTLRQGGAEPLPGTAAAYVGGWTVDWANFRVEYPWIDGDVNQWLARLAVALGPTFAELGGADAGAGDGPAGRVEGDSLRDGGGRPIHPVTLEPSWLTTTVVGLTSGIAADQAWDRLPFLADALEEAGCDRADLLSHCRANGPHVRGCWVVDLLLGKV